MAGTDSEIAELRQAVEQLALQVQVLTEAVDGLTDEIQWRNRQLRDNAEMPSPMVLRSMPLDPCAKDWEINRVKPAEVAALREQVTRTGSQGTLFG